jgi:chromosome segregation ATPase
MSHDPILAALARLEAGQADVSDRLARLEAEQAGMSDRLARWEAGQAQLEAGQARLEAGQARLEAGQAQLEAGQSKLRSDFLDELGSTRAALMGRIDTLQDSLTEIRDDIAVNYGASNAAVRANDNTREQLGLLREQVNVMYQQIKRLESRVRDITGDP